MPHMASNDNERRHPPAAAGNRRGNDWMGHARWRSRACGAAASGHELLPDAPRPPLLILKRAPKPLKTKPLRSPKHSRKHTHAHIQTNKSSTHTDTHTHTHMNIHTQKERKPLYVRPLH